ncbi:MAG: OmpH family outer membrane protein [Psychrilyobacter sp.]|nr:OmpH family outer membrane protein [Psychrilyobacter sp.]
MKKMIMVVMAVVMSMSVFASKIATVNTQKIFQGYSKTQAVKAKLETEKTKLEGQLATKAKSLEATAKKLNAKGDKVTVAEKDKFERQQATFAKERQALQNKLGKMEFDEMSTIQAEIKSAVVRVAREKKYETVLEEGAVLYGGTDITSEVLKKLESTKKIKL